MIKNNNKGFVITEVLILSTVIMGVLTLMYIQFKSINRGYQYSFKYDTVEGLYLANNIINYINDGNYDNLVEQVNNNQKGYIDITECNIENSNLISYCNSLFQKSEVEKIIFTKEDLKDIKNNINDFDNDMQNYIRQIKTLNDENDYRIIVKYKDGSYTSMRFNNSKEYVQSGLIAYLDGINNTGNGHSSDIQTWKDLSNNNNDATLYNNPTWSNNSLTFDGKTNFGRLENTVNQAFPNGATVETRVKMLSITPAQNSNQKILGNFHSEGIGLIFNDTYTFRTNMYSTGGVHQTSVESDNTSNLNEYYTVTTTYNNSEQKLYINGKLEKAINRGNNVIIETSQVPFGIGGDPTTTGRVNTYSNAEYQNVLIYDRALTENEVLRNYQADLARY